LITFTPDSTKELPNRNNDSFSLTLQKAHDFVGIFGYRGVYNSAWLGCLMALVSDTAPNGAQPRAPILEDAYLYCLNKHRVGEAA
jgi:hypothetical protein